ncbi:FtsK/SpoIIIE domain-containing protein [Kocuria turfanensis]|uniref:FtsK domain-containing protein n=1 Tax=Kocuria turfanensis TaxID=388357 RepID=A0A512IIR4_9MICC|nr:FtsK/SpoIIIE domain-containing protein [Kocuria turfanensis]GEO97580.1 hypothetical protein KTU01_37030 [Kocuria turfanensis]
MYEPSISRPPTPPRQGSGPSEPSVTVADAARFMEHMWTSFTWAFPLYFGLAFAAQPSFALGFAAVLSVPVWAVLVLYRLGGPSTLDALKSLDRQRVLSLVQHGLQIRHARHLWGRALTRLQLVDENGRPLTFPSDVKVTPYGITYRVPVARESDVRLYEDRAGSLRRLLRVRELSIVSPHPGVMDVICRNSDPLEDGFSIEQFRASLPAGANSGEVKKPAYVARGEDGQPIGLGFGHTLVIGNTGSGKGSALWALYAAYAAGIPRGTVEFWGIDPKNAELKGMDAAFQRIATEPEQIAELLDALEEERQARQRRGGRSFVQSPQDPAIVLLVDEFATMFTGMEAKTAKQAQAIYASIMTKGRSAGIMVAAFAQQPQKEILGPTRSLYAQRMCLRVDTALETDLVLGTGAVEAGALCHKIDTADESNDYYTAGLGWMVTDGGRLARVRFPYTSDEVLNHIVNASSVSSGPAIRRPARAEELMGGSTDTDDEQSRR